MRERGRETAAEERNITREKELREYTFQRERKGAESQERRITITRETEERKIEQEREGEI